jgi:hypothetical protein
MRAIALAALSLLASVSAFAAPSVDRIDIVDKGIYAIKTGDQTPDANTPTGEIAAVQKSKIIEATDTVAARVGVEFGFQYVVIGKPAGEEVPLHIVITYPKPGIHDPAEAAPLLLSRFQRVKKIGETVYLGYGIEHDWEIVPGTWTFQIWHGGKKLAEQSFTVTAGN